MMLWLSSGGEHESHDAVTCCRASLSCPLTVMRRFLISSLIFSYSLAFQLPFSVPFFKSKDSIYIEQAQVSPRIAIIGAGAGGSSAAFWISKAKERYGINVEIDVYERSDYIGGRKF